MTEHAKYRLRCQDWNPTHVRFAVFDPKGANCGELCVEASDVFRFLRTAWNGDLYWNGHLPEDAVAHSDKYGGRSVE